MVDPVLVEVENCDFLLFCHFVSLFAVGAFPDRRVSRHLEDANEGLHVSEEFASGLERFQVHFLVVNGFVFPEVPNRRRHKL